MGSLSGSLEAWEFDVEGLPFLSDGLRPAQTGVVTSLISGWMKSRN